MLKCLFHALLVDHLLKAPGVTLIGRNAIQRFSEYLMAIGTSESTNIKGQIDYTAKAHHVPNTATLGLVDISAHIPASGTDAVIKTNVTIEYGFLPGFINVI
jgi:hypothetical protein